MSALEVGDRIVLRNPPFRSHWEVVRILEAGAELRYLEGTVRFVGYGQRLEAPNGTELTLVSEHSFLGRAHWDTAERLPLEEAGEPLDDTAAMNQIHAALDGVDWSADELDRVAEIVTATGRLIRDPNEVDGG